MPIKVELDIFSGQPNPTWTLHADLEPTVLDGLRSKIAVPAAPRLRLGYRGFLLEIDQREAFGVLGVQRVRVFEDVATIETGPEQQSFLVPGVEDTLIESATRSGHASLIESAEGRSGTSK